MSRDDGNIERWQTFKEGDMDSFRAIYDGHFANLFEYGFRLVGNDELVKDAIHDLFVKLWNNRANLGSVTNIRSYLLVALRSTIYNKLDQKKRIRLYDEPYQMPFEMEFSVESHFIKKETDKLQTQKLINALNQLTDRQKEAIYMRYFEGMRYEDISAALHITTKATYKLVARGIEALRQVMNVTPCYLLVCLFICVSVVCSNETMAMFFSY